MTGNPVVIRLPVCLLFLCCLLYLVNSMNLEGFHLLFRFSFPLIPEKIEVTFVTASSQRALSLKGDAAHISVDAVIAQAESARQLFAAQQFTILHIGALQNIDPVMRAVGFNFCKSEACISAEHCADHLVKNLKEQRPDKRELRGDTQPFPVGLYADSDRFFDQGQGFFLRDIFDHLQINGRSREDHPLGMQLFFGGKLFIFAA